MLLRRSGADVAARVLKRAPGTLIPMPPRDPGARAPRDPQGNAPLRLKMRRGEPLTPDEQKAWDDSLRVLTRLGNAKARKRRAAALPQVKEYDSKSGASGRSTGSSVTQGPAGGIARVVRGGLPSLGKAR